MKSKSLILPLGSHIHSNDQSDAINKFFIDFHNSNKNDYQIYDYFSIVRASFALHTNHNDDIKESCNEKQNENVLNYFKQNNYLSIIYGFEIFYILFKDDKPYSLIRYYYNTIDIRVEIWADPKAVKEIKNQVMEFLPKMAFNVSTALKFDKYEELNKNTTSIMIEDINKPTKEFYPWFKHEFEKYFDKFFKSSKNILLLIGPAGTGKTTFIRYLLSKYQKDALTANSESILNDSRFIPSFIEMEYNMLVLEDADNIIGSRKDGNILMSSLLNLTDGLVPSKKKIIISTNLPSVDKVDYALLRPGRCFDVLCFEELNIDESNKARQSIGMDTVNFENKHRTYTLAEVLDYENTMNIDKRICRPIGFIA